MGNVVPMDSKLLSNYWYMSSPSWALGNSYLKIVFSQKSGLNPPPLKIKNLNFKVYIFIIYPIYIVFVYIFCISLSIAAINIEILYYLKVCINLYFHQNPKNWVCLTAFFVRWQFTK